MFGAPAQSPVYQWWYVDAVSDDGADALTLIAFVGSVFSPYYAWTRRRGAARPEAHCAFNVALYGRSARAWAMTERGAAALGRERDRLVIGPSCVRRDGLGLHFEIDEVAVPLPRRLRGAVSVTARAWSAHEVALDDQGRHRWTPYAPSARVAVAFDRPRVRWHGHAYVDGNAGDEPLEAGFLGWQWARARLDDEHTLVTYDTVRRDGTEDGFALRFDALGHAQQTAPPPASTLARTRWGIRRCARSDGAVRVLQTLEDAPFYARSLVALQVGEQPTVAMHESLSLQRFAAPWVQCMLPFRMPRRG